LNAFVFCDMFLRPRVSCAVAFQAALLIVALCCVFLRDGGSAELSPYVSQAPPRLALGDFDGDGHIDTAVILDDVSGTRISIQFAGSSSTVALAAPVSAVVEGDVDDDGDLDLIAATPSGELVIWINDGHGQFTQEPVLPAGGLSGAPAVSEIVTAAVAIGIRAPALGISDLSRVITAASTGALRDPLMTRTNRRDALPLLRAPPRHSV
jgi:hypothetical protein